MPLKRAALFALLALGGVLVDPGMSPAESQAAVGVNSYSNSSGLNVFTPELRWKADMDPRTEAALDFSVDAVSAASFNYGNLSRTHRLDPARRPGTCNTCHPPTDALTGATRSYKEERRGFGGSLARRIGDERAIQVKASYHRNDENDYSSNSYQAGISFDFNDANTTLGLQGNLLNDRIFPVISSFSDSLDTIGVDLTLTQVLTPLTVAELDYGFARAVGYEGSPYSFIEIGNDSTHPMAANEPREKQRNTASLRLKQGLLPGLAAELGYRYYEDDWGVQGHTVDINLSQAMGRFVLEPHARLYFQPQGAYFFENFYQSAQTYMTRDLKLSTYQTSLLGVTLRGKLNESFGTELNYSHFTRQDSLDYSRYFADGPENGDLYQVVLTYE